MIKVHYTHVGHHDETCHFVKYFRKHEKRKCTEFTMMQLCEPDEKEKQIVSH